MLEAIIGGVIPAFKPISALKIFDLRHIAALKAVNDDQLYFHLFGYNALYIYACLLTCRGVIARLCKPCEVRRQLNEYSVILNAPHNSGYGLPGREKRGVFSPCAEQFLMGKRDFSVRRNIFDYYPNILTDEEAVARVGYSRDGDRVYRQQRYISAADITKCSEGLHMRDFGVYNIALAFLGQYVFPAKLLCLSA